MSAAAATYTDGTHIDDVVERPTGSGDGGSAGDGLRSRMASRFDLCRRRSLDWLGNRVVVFEDDDEGVEEEHGDGDNEPELTVSPMSDSAWYRRMTLNSTPPTLPQVQSWDFDALSYTKEALIPAVAFMFGHYDLLSTFSIDPDTFTRFVAAAMERHPPHEYHNWYHAVSCAHVSFLLLSLAGGDNYVTQADIFALLFGALVHDVDHAGHNNDFEVKSGTDRAKKYNNDAVLENHSVDVTLDEILALPGCDVFAGMEAEDREFVLNVARDVVVSTDPARHGDLLKAMSSLAEKVATPIDDTDDNSTTGGKEGGDIDENDDAASNHLPTPTPPPPAWNKDDPASRTLLCRMIVHAADISNPVHNSFSVARDWCHRISAEFRNQATMERQLGLDVTPFMDGLDDEYRVAKLQTDFYKFMAMPFFRVVGLLLPEAAHLAQRGHNNMRSYQDIVDYVERKKGMKKA